VTAILQIPCIGGVTFYEINGDVNDSIVIIPEHLKRTKVEAGVPDCMAK
jgi:hypothetical protein